MIDYYYFNGSLEPSYSCRISITDRSYLLGDGLFETILVQKNKPVYLSEHLIRLQQSASFFAYSLLPTEELTAAIYSVIAANALEKGSIRLTVSPQESQGLLAKVNSTLNILVTFRRGCPYGEELYERGFTAVIAQTTRRNQYSPLSRHKTTNFADNILAKQEARLSGSDEAILLNTAGMLTEATVANLFLVINGEVFTPPIADGVLPGIMRQKVLDLCRNINISAKEQTMTLMDLQRAEEAFFTNSLLGIMPITKVQSTVYLTKFTQRLMAGVAIS